MKKAIKLVLILSITILIPIAILTMIDNYYSTKSNIYIEGEVTKTISSILTEALKKPINEQLSKNKILDCKYDNNQVIKGVYINAEVANAIIIEVNQTINQLIDENVINEAISKIDIPLGSLVSKAIFSNLGPNISIKAIPISSYKSNIYTKTKSLGINNSNFEVYVNIKIDVQTLIPLKEQAINYESNVLIGSILIQGEIPYYYYYSGTGTIEALPQ